VIVLPDQQTSPEQFAIFRRMSPQRRLAMAEQLYWSARSLKEAAVRNQSPEWLAAQVRAEVTRIFLRKIER
jgi:hypothetical protein